MTQERKRPGPESAKGQAEQPTFESAFTQLRETVEALEAGNLPLEEATKLFDQGMQLAKTCNELLSAAELKITRLQRTFGEQMAMMSEPTPPAPEDDLPAFEDE